MLQKILLLITTSFLLSFSAVAQDVSVDVTDILYDENGSLIDQGAISFTFNDGLPIDVIIFDNPCESQNTYERFVPGSIDLLICQEPGEYCYQLISKPPMSEPCTLEVFCVTLCECRLVDRKGILVRNCGKCDEKPTGPIINSTNNSVQNVNTEELLLGTLDKLEVEKSTLVEKTEIHASKRNFTLNTVYPNPFNNSFNLEVDSNVAIEADIEIFDLTGKIVFRKTTYLEVGMNNLNVLFQHQVPNGAYLLKIQGGNGTLITQKIIKQE